MTNHRTRTGLCLCTILATVPYLTLKLLWLTGSDVGVTDPEFLDDPILHALNLVTAGMDAIAVVIAVAFVSRWGLRVPAWLLLLPAWVAAGLLTPIVVATPLSAVIAATGNPPQSGLPLESWVSPIVYAGFAIQGITLVGGFLFYAIDRWGHLLRGHLAAPESSVAQTMLRQLASLVAVLGAGVALTSLVWAWGLPWGVPADLQDDRTATTTLVGTTHALFAAAGVVATLALVHGTAANLSYRATAVTAWVGSAAMFAWGLWGLINVLTTSPLSSDSTDGLAVVNLHTLVQTFAGLVLGLVALAAVVLRTQNGEPDNGAARSQGTGRGFSGSRALSTK